MANECGGLLRGGAFTHFQIFDSAISMLCNTKILRPDVMGCVIYVIFSLESSCFERYRGMVIERKILKFDFSYTVMRLFRVLLFNKLDEYYVKIRVFPFYLSTYI